MLNLNPNSKTPPSYEQILSEIRGLRSELKDDIRELKNEMRGMKEDIRDLRNELKETKHELNGRIDRVENEIRSSMRHAHIMTGSVVGIALAVIYFVFTH